MSSFPRTLAAAAGLAAATLSSPTARAQTIVSPADRALFEGNSNSSYPLGRFDGRFQQLHGDLGATARTLTGHAYRRDATTERGDVLGFTCDLEVVLSVAAHAPDAASTTFANNHGPSPQTVVARTRIAFPTTSRPAADPAPVFEHRIPYGAPFQLPAGAPLCVDVTVFGNTTPSGTDVNFLPYLDAHATAADGSVTQPGFPFGSGCAAPGAGRPHSGLFDFERAADGSLSLAVRSRDGIASIPGVPARTALIVGGQLAPMTWPWNAGCTIAPSLDATYTLPGDNDAAGDWLGALGPLPQLPVGQRFYVQLASSAPAAGTPDLTASNPSVVTVPPPAPTSLPAVRVASGSDRSATRGTVSRTVTVTEFR